MNKIKYLLRLMIFSGLFCFTVSSVTLEKKFNIPKPQAEKPLKSTGIILAFHKFPSEQEQTQISEVLNQDDLTLSKKFKGFKTLVFSWPKLKTKNKAQKICRKLSKLKNLKYCESDTLLQPNGSDNSKTQASSPSAHCTKNCGDYQTSISALHNTLKNTLPKEACELFPAKNKLKDGTLTDYWAQEMTGADLLREELEQTDPLPEDKFLVAVIDGPLFNHHVHVQNIISHEGQQAVLPALSSSQIQSVLSQSPSASGYLTMVVMFLVDIVKNPDMNMKWSLEKTPSFINNSINWMESRSIYEAMSHISPPAILVQAAGNSHPKPLDSMASKFSENFDSIIVGSLSPSGVVSEFSQVGEEVHILAPSDNYIASADADGNYKVFTGTSGAAPLVTGALAGFEWLSGYHPTAKEAKLLLEKTALPTIHSEFEEPQKHGVGMLNAYKLGKVAQRLKNKCGNNHECFKNEINNPKNYEFSTDQNLSQQLQSAFPDCFDPVQSYKPVSCTDKKSTLKKLRQAVLLDTNNAALWKNLHCVYKQEGFLESAFATRQTAFAITKNVDFLNDHDERRIAGELGVQISQLSENLSFKAIKYAGRIGGEEGLQIFNKFTQHPSEYVRQSVADNVGDIEEEEAIQILKELAQDPSEYVRESVAESAGDIEGEEEEEAIQIVKELAQDPSEGVRNIAFESAEIIRERKSQNITNAGSRSF